MRHTLCGVFSWEHEATEDDHSKRENDNRHGERDKDQRHGGAVAEGVAKCLGHCGSASASGNPLHQMRLRQAKARSLLWRRKLAPSNDELELASTVTVASATPLTKAKPAGAVALRRGGAKGWDSSELRVFGLAQGLRHHLGRADAGQVDHKPERANPRQQHGGNIRRRSRSREREKIIAFLKQDTQTSPPASNSPGQPPPAKQ